MVFWRREVKYFVNNSWRNLAKKSDEEIETQRKINYKSQTSEGKKHLNSTIEEETIHKSTYARTKIMLLRRERKRQAQCTIRFAILCRRCLRLKLDKQTLTIFFLVLLMSNFMTFILVGFHLDRFKFIIMNKNRWLCNLFATLLRAWSKNRIKNSPWS